MDLFVGVFTVSPSTFVGRGKKKKSVTASGIARGTTGTVCSGHRHYYTVHLLLTPRSGLNNPISAVPSESPGNICSGYRHRYI